VDEAALLREAQRFLNVSGLRLYRCDEGGSSMTEIASAGRVTRDALRRELPLSRLPWHRWALDSGHILQVDQSDPEALMNEGEAGMSMDPAIKSACLVPIVSGGQRLGILDAMELRDPDRKSLDLTDRSLLLALADQLATQWTSAAPPASVALSSAHELGGPHLTRRLKGFHRDVVNPLTCIIGSVELIRYKQDGLGPETLRYLNTIERSASRIHEATISMIDGVSGFDADRPRMGADSGHDDIRTHHIDILQDGASAFTRPISFMGLEEKRATVTPDIDAAEARHRITAGRNLMPA
jgi:hypothetical protein